MAKINCITNQCLRSSLSLSLIQPYIFLNKFFCPHFPHSFYLLNVFFICAQIALIYLKLHYISSLCAPSAEEENFSSSSSFSLSLYALLSLCSYFAIFYSGWKTNTILNFSLFLAEFFGCSHWSWLCGMSNSL